MFMGQAWLSTDILIGFTYSTLKISFLNSNDFVIFAICFFIKNQAGTVVQWIE